ncbi:MAG: ribokinase [Thermomicrobiales bacterium]|nr:ribokinase [Thermomicrobiales bacterium]
MDQSFGRVLAAGAINTDLVARVERAPAAGETVTGSSFDVFGGGKGANQAVAAARSGAATAMLGAVGDDDFGRHRLSDLLVDDIDVTFVDVTDAARSGVTLITVEEATGENRIAYVPGATLTVGPEQARAAVAALNPSVVLATLELPEATRAALFVEARARRARVVLNATPEAAGAQRHLPQIDVLIVNEVEAGEMLGRHVGPNDAVAAARALQALGPEAVVITLGAAGAVVLSEGEPVRLPAPPVRVVDTTGAGDAFCGAFAARLAAGTNPITAARAGVIAGSLAATRAGAQPSMPTREEIDALMTEGA